MSREHKIFIKATRCYAFSLFIILNVPYLLVLGVVLPSYLHSRQSYCGFIDGFSCSFGASVGQSFSISSILSLVPAMICVAIWGRVFGKYCKFKLRKRGLKYGIYNFLPFACAIIGFVLGFFLWLIHLLCLDLILS
jgi:hypothetical protein